jgi:hypothetical protein
LAGAGDGSEPRLWGPAVQAVAGETGQVRFIDEKLATRLYVLRQAGTSLDDGRLDAKVRLVSLSGKRSCLVQFVFFSRAGRVVDRSPIEEWRLREAHPVTVEASSRRPAESYLLILGREVWADG